MQENTEKFISAQCKDEHCIVCGKDSTKIVDEFITFDDPEPNRPPLTTHLCEYHFDMIMGNLDYEKIVTKKYKVLTDYLLEKFIFTLFSDSNIGYAVKFSECDGDSTKAYRIVYAKMQADLC